jgi:hypothetical protein
METSKVIGALGALAQESRLEIFRLLVQRGPDGMTAGDIARPAEHALLPCWHPRPDPSCGVAESMSLPFDKLTKLSLQKHLGEIGQTEAEVTKQSA